MREKTTSGSASFCQEQRAKAVVVSAEAYRCQNQQYELMDLTCFVSTGHWTWCNYVGNVFIAHFGIVNTNESLLKCHTVCHIRVFLLTMSILSWTDCMHLLIAYHITKQKTSQAGLVCHWIQKNTLGMFQFRGLQHESTPKKISINCIQYGSATQNTVPNIQNPSLKELRLFF